jgi:hypothetical protein
MGGGSLAHAFGRQRSLLRRPHDRCRPKGTRRLGQWRSRCDATLAGRLARVSSLPEQPSLPVGCGAIGAVRARPTPECRSPTVESGVGERRASKEDCYLRRGHRSHAENGPGVRARLHGEPRATAAPGSGRSAGERRPSYTRADVEASPSHPCSGGLPRARRTGTWLTATYLLRFGRRLSTGWFRSVPRQIRRAGREHAPES